MKLKIYSTVFGVWCGTESVQKLFASIDVELMMSSWILIFDVRKLDFQLSSLLLLSYGDLILNNKSKWSEVYIQSFVRCRLYSHVRNSSLR